ncbi:MAG: DegT/DnrJ/EryC1/StrS family aminotransferase, partial [Candidatus Omnitrophica bacterium]|nr:DegT/DnrJ/EryC1/StrS family aminotransferase [Candidatus Omnitrophota bacterium]
KEIIKNITKKTKAIIPVHFAGHPCDLQEIKNIANKRNLLVIEDAAHALGAEYKGSKIGSCRYSDMTIFSFHPVKSITTGEGGAITTNNKKLYEKLMMLRSHGITKDSSKFKVKRPKAQGGWYHEMQCLGFNCRITDFQCALGISQLKKLDKFIQKRREIVKIYNKKFGNNNFFELPVEKDYVKSSWHLYPIRLKDGYKKRKKAIFTKLRSQGVGAQIHYIPVYLQPYYRHLGYRNELCPHAQAYYQRTITLPLYPTMTQAQIKRVIQVTKTIIAKYGR